MDSKEKLEQARFFKERGTNYFKNSKYPLALKMYKKSIGFVDSTMGKIIIINIIVIIVVFSIIWNTINPQVLDHITERF